MPAPYSRAPPETAKTAPIPIGAAEFAGVDPEIDAEQTSQTNANFFMFVIRRNALPLDVGELIALVLEPESIARR